MSRIGRLPVQLPDGVTVAIDGADVTVKGPKGELSMQMHRGVQAVEADGAIAVTLDEGYEDRAVWGLTRALLANLVAGVHEGYEKKLLIEGVGFRASASGKKLTMNLGFSHPVEMEAPEGVDVSVDEMTILVSGIDKQAVGQFAAKIRARKPVEPYKGKGIKYEGEHVRRKVGKRVVASGAPGA